jgi:hypothetical protein
MKLALLLSTSLLMLIVSGSCGAPSPDGGQLETRVAELETQVAQAETPTLVPAPIQMPTLPPAWVPIADFADTCIFPANISDSLELDGTIRFEWVVAPPGSTISLLIHRASDGAYVGSIVSNGASIGEAEIEIGPGVYQVMAICEDAGFYIAITKAEQ